MATTPEVMHWTRPKPDGTYLTVYTEPGGYADVFERVLSVPVDADGNVRITDTAMASLADRNGIFTISRENLSQMLLRAGFVPVQEKK